MRKRYIRFCTVSLLCLLSVRLLYWPAPISAQAGAALPASPPLAERLDRLAAEIERNRIDLHVPGAAIAIVRGDQVILARGFGLADVSKKTPVTPDTRFFIGSTTKAFTATLVGMLVDEGLMHWDDPVEKYVPEFKLAVQSKTPGDRATLRDVLSHRTGFTRMPFLDMNNGMSSEEILRQASSAEPLAPFRARFLYNNEHYVAAGLAAGAVAGTSWDALIKTRILTPLGMTSTRTTKDAWNEPGTARGYSWDEARKKLEPLSLETQGINIDGLAPAGAISSTAHDMSLWLRFLLRQGVPEGKDGKPLISPASLATTWTPQIQVGGGAGYGMGWIARRWQGQRLIAHDGALMGFSAVVGMLPDSDLGFVVLTNTLSALPALALQLVPRYLLGELPPVAKSSIDLKPYVGRYIANVATFTNEVFTISQRNGRLVIDIPSQLESALNPPGADGRWPLAMTDQLAVSFDRDNKGKVVGLRLHQGGSEAAARPSLAFEVPREGVVIAPELPLRDVQKYVGRYAGGGLEFTVLIQNQRLAVRLPNNSSLDLRPPDASGRRVARANDAVAFAFEESPAGAVIAMNFHRPNLPVMRLTPPSDSLPTAAEIMALRRIPASAASRTERTTGRVRFPQSGVEGRFSSASAGGNRYRLDIDLGRFGQTQVVLNTGRGWRAASGDSISELPEKELRQVRLAEGLFGDWRKHFDEVRVMRTAQLEGRKVYVVQLESAGLPPTTVSVDAETGDVLQVQRTMRVGGAGAMSVVTTYSDYRDVGGTREPYRYVETSEQIGRTIYEVERVEVGLELSNDTFRLKPPAAK